ncbi:MAG TPA: protein kinase, partial [Polyangiaceae bacterium]|nr:protein kinase [Polyangiaceae bacterium]
MTRASRPPEIEPTSGSDFNRTESTGHEPAPAPSQPPGAPLPKVRLPGLSAETDNLERFQIGELLGQGATSRVYAAFDRDLGRDVAVKVVRVESAWSKTRFFREARVTASLAHPNVVPVYDAGRTGDDYFLTLPRIKGRSLGTMIRRAIADGREFALPIATLVEVMLKVCDAVAYAHDKGVVHQDIKPDNVLIGDYGQVMLVDWGAASVSGSSEEQRMVIGTPAYMAPEQARGASEPRSDVYSLGVTLFHALFQRKPLSAPNRDAFWQRKLRGEIDAPTREELSRVPRALYAIALCAMNVQPDARYQSVAALAQALRDYVAGGAAWSAPIAAETFADDSWRARWQSLAHGDYEVQDGWLVSRATHNGVLFYRERLSGGVAIEFDGKLEPGSPVGDLSVIWTEDDVVGEVGARWPAAGRRTYALQTGAYGNLTVGIRRDFHAALSARSLILEVGRQYRIRAEIDGRLLRLLIDGEV